MSSRRSFHRIEAEDAVRAVLDAHRSSSALAIRRALREAFYRVSAGRSTWYAAVRTVTGGGVMDIPDPVQRALLPRGARTRKERRRAAR